MTPNGISKWKKKEKTNIFTLEIDLKETVLSTASHFQILYYVLDFKHQNTYI